MSPAIPFTQAYATPYTSLEANFLTQFSGLALVLTLLGTLGLRLARLNPENGYVWSRG